MSLLPLIAGLEGREVFCEGGTHGGWARDVGDDNQVVFMTCGIILLGFGYPKVES